MTARWAAILVSMLLGATAAQAKYAGKPLVVVLRDLQAAGLRLVYSDDVVRPEMIVLHEPRATEPRKILDEVLREHSLQAQAGPRGTLLIVRTTRAESGLSAPEPATIIPVVLAEIVVTPSRFSILGDSAGAREFLDREEVRRVPHLADDVYRAIARIPGTASSDVSARFHLRGGAQDETQVVLDGAEIYDPFHVKDLYRAFSTIDAEAVGSVEIFSGGYPVQYGGRMSGVVDITTLAPSEDRLEGGIGLLATRALSQGTFRDGRASWLISARHGYLRELVRLVDIERSSELDPQYNDVLGKVEWIVGSRAVVSAHLLAATDKLRIREQPATDARADYRDVYGWLNVRASITPRLFAQSVLSVASLERERGGTFANIGEEGTVEDRRDAQIVDWKNDVTFDLSPRSVIRAGITARTVQASYDYEGASHIALSTFGVGGQPQDVRRSAHVRPSGSELSAYIADRLRISDRLVMEAGLRAANESYTPDGTVFDPRVQLAWAPHANTAVRVAWGVVHQPQRIDELPVEDGVTEFEAGQRSIHRVLSIEQRLAHGLHTRIELYDKSLERVRPRYENLYNGLIAFPELRADRVRIAPSSARARGVEVLFRSPPSAPWSGWVSYTLSSVTDRIGTRDVPRAWDQRHATTFSVNYRPAQAWNLNVAGTWRSGWPTTPVIAELQGDQIVSRPGDLGAERLPSYSRIDFRATRTSGRLGVFLELFNALNQSNASRVESFQFNVDQNGTVEAVPVTESILGVIPSFGLTWQF